MIILFLLTAQSGLGMDAPTLPEVHNEKQNNQNKMNFHHNSKNLVLDFSQKVRGYSDRVILKYRSNKNPEVQNLIAAMRSLYFSHDSFAKQVPRWIDNLKQVSVHDSTDEAVRQLQTALLIKASLLLHSLIESTIFNTLRSLDNSINYWEEQNNNPWSYFVNKMPYKHFSLSKQQTEINSHISMLQAVRDDHLSLLGKLAQHEAQFNEKLSFEQKQQWLSKIVSMVYKQLMPLSRSISEVKTFEKLLDQLISLFDLLPKKHFEHVNRVLKNDRKPNHIERNWLRYAVIGTATVAAAISVYNNYDTVIGKIDELNNGVSHTFETYIKSPLQTIYRAFAGKEQQEGAQQANWQEIGNDLNNAFGLQEEDEQAQAARHVLQNEYRNALNPFVEQLNLTPEQVNNAVENLDAPLLRRAFDCGVLEVRQHADEMQRELQVQRGLNLVARAQAINQAVTQVGGIVGACGNVLPITNVQQKVMQRAVAPHIGRTVNKLTQTADDVERIINQNKATAAMAAIAPVTLVLSGLAFGTRKIYGLLRSKPDYQPMREAIIELAHIFNEHDALNPITMDSKDYGTVLYLVHKLQKEVIKVPQAKRKRFRDDVYKLAHPYLSNEKKLRVIDLMYRGNGEFLNSVAIK